MGRSAIIATVAGVIALGFAAGMIFTLLPLFGIGGNQIEHANVAFDIHPNGKSIVFASAGGDLLTFDLGTRKVIRLTNTAAVESLPRYSPDGKAIVFSMSQGEDEGEALYKMPAVGGKTERLTHDKGVSDSEANFSSDGKQLVFSRAYRYRPYSMGGMVWDNYDVCILNLADGKVRRLTNQAYYGGGSAAIVEGGKSVIYSAMGHEDDVNSQMFKVGLEPGSEPTKFMPPKGDIGRIGAWAGDVAFSRDGKLMTFISDRAEPFAYDIYIADASGANARPLHFTSVSHYNQAPKFAPDGKSIFVLAGTQSNGHGRAIFSLYRVDLSGNATKLADSGLFTDPVKWKGK